MTHNAAGIRRIALAVACLAVLAGAGAAAGSWLATSVALRPSKGGADIGAPVIVPGAAILGALVGALALLSAGVLVAVVLGRIRSRRRCQQRATR